MSLQQRVGADTRSQERRAAHSLQAHTLVSLLTMLLLFVAALSVYGYNLGFQPLWLDEGWTWSVVGNSNIWSLLLDFARPSQSYPLYHLLLKPVMLTLGDSEAALRALSAVVGALTVPVIYVLGRELRGWVLGLSAAVLLLVSHFAAWQAQDTKAYSLMLLVALLLALTLARALRRGARRDWLLFGAVVVVTPFVHRFLLFTVLGCVVVWAFALRRYRLWVLLGAGVVGAGMVGALVLAQDYFSATPQFARVPPHRAAFRTFVQFSIGLWFRHVQPAWSIPLLLLPFGVLAAVGGIRLLWDLKRGRNVRGALIVLALAGVPAVLFAVLLVLRPFYAPRYTTALLPFYLLILGWSLPEPVAVRRWRFGRLWAVGTIGVLALALLASIRSLLMPEAGLFSGSVVKEDYRGALRYLATHMEPDDALVVHPYYLVPMYNYYAPRVSDELLPAPETYRAFATDPQYDLPEFEAEFEADMQGHQRVWLMIAPMHASVHDPPEGGPSEDQTKLGTVGTLFQQGNEEWQPCETTAVEFLDVWVYCLERR